MNRLNKNAMLEKQAEWEWLSKFKDDLAKRGVNQFFKREDVQTALAGMAIGGLGNMAVGDKGRKLENLLTGAVTGGLAGGALPHLIKYFTKVPPEQLRKAKEEAARKSAAKSRLDGPGRFGWKGGALIGAAHGILDTPNRAALLNGIRKEWIPSINEFKRYNKQHGIDMKAGKFMDEAKWRERNLIPRSIEHDIGSMNLGGAYRRATRAYTRAPRGAKLLTGLRQGWRGVHLRDIGRRVANIGMRGGIYGTIGAALLSLIFSKRYPKNSPYTPKGPVALYNLPGMYASEFGKSLSDKPLLTSALTHALNDDK